MMQPSFSLPTQAQRSHDTAFLQIMRLFALATGLALLPALAAEVAAPSSGLKDRAARAASGQERMSTETAKFADWIVHSADNQGMPFLIVDKSTANVLVFDPGGKLQGSAPALLGLSRGDDSTPGIGERKLSTITPEERTTPAGRFVASLARNLQGAEILWVDYATAISLHKVVKGTPAERRAQRLDSPSPADNRVSYGCINVPAKFYDQFVSPAFTGTNGVVYILPETRSAREVFGSYDVDDPAAASRPAGPGAR